VYQPIRPRPRHRMLVSVLLVGILVAGLGFLNYVRPLPTAVANTLPTGSEIGTVQLTWPPNAQSALGATDFGIVASHGPQSPLPTASLAKMITALAVLQKKPLQPGQQGPTITLSQADVDLYNHYLNEQGAVANVQAGEHITEYQALQAMLMVSANNMADTLAIWAFGSLPEYRDYANNLLHQWKLSQTTVGSDASGFTPDTKSTARDLVELGQRVLQQPLLSAISTQDSADVPVAGSLKNSNVRLSHGDLTVLKTGLTDQAGGCLLFTSQVNVAGQPLTMTGAILGAHDLGTALDGAHKLVTSAKPNFIVQMPIAAGQQFGTLTTPWGESAPLTAQANVTIIAWKGAALTPHLELNAINHPVALGAPIGSVVVDSEGNRASSPITLGKAIAAPSFAWRLLRH
jgi:serine-type D-Ala-D-Ala carboxypeptidase (penicillin-binding protein 5/6)